LGDGGGPADPWERRRTRRSLGTAEDPPILGVGRRTRQSLGTAEDPPILGCIGSPFLLPYNSWAHLSPICWTKCFWQSLDKYKVDFQIHYPSLEKQREGDMSVMDFLLPHMPSHRIMASINRCRCYLRILFLSDVASLDGTHIISDMVWGNRLRLLSSMRFPPENPTLQDWTIWSNTSINVTHPGLYLAKPLGTSLNKKPHFEWPWRFDGTRQELHITNELGTYTIFRKRASLINTRSSQAYLTTNHTTPTTSNGIIVSAECDPTGCPSWGNDTSHTDITDFWEQIKDWGDSGCGK
jgi:hypothetical protein